LSSIPRVLTIAGSDSGGGAGIEADLKTFAALGVHGLVAITAVTAQNTTGVSRIFELPAEMVRSQIEAVVGDIGVDYAKTGMLFSSAIINEIARAAIEFGLRLVVDPVMVAKSGAILLRKDALSSLKSNLLPLAEVVTPNLDEAELLTGLKISSVQDSITAGEEILKLGPKAAVIKGGHLPGEPVDVLCQKGKEPLQFYGARASSSSTHGTGCTFSSALAAYLATGSTVEDAVRSSKQFVYNAILYGLKIGKGVGPVNPMSNLEADAERHRICEKMSDAITILESSDSVTRLSPECQINIVMALPKPYAISIDAVCAVPGRIFNVAGHLKAAACPAFGASRHMAKVVLTAMEYDPSYRSAMNIRLSNEIIDACIRLGLSISSYDRKLEPKEVKSMEGGSVPWGVGEAIKSFGRVPDIIYHMGDVGKEPMINILGTDSVDVVMKAIKIGKSLCAIS